MSPTTIALLTGLVGAIIGASASIITVMVQARIQDRRERHKHVVDLAIEDYKIQLEIGKLAGGPREILPIFLFVDYHLRLSKLIEGGELTPDSYTRICKENTDFLEIVRKIDSERRK